MKKNTPWFNSNANTISSSFKSVYANTNLIISSKTTNNNKKIFILPAISSLTITLNYNCSKNIEFYDKIQLNKNVFMSKNSWFFWKFKYNGKGLKIKKSKINQQILFNLGASHISKIWFNKQKVFIFRTKKNTFSVLTAWKLNSNLLFFFKNIRKYNKYTKRGLRLNKQPVIRRFGKVSQLTNKKR